MTKTQIREQLQNEIAELEAVIDSAETRLDACYQALEKAQDMRSCGKGAIRDNESRSALVMSLIGKAGQTFTDLKTQEERREYWRVSNTIRNHEKSNLLMA